MAIIKSVNVPTHRGMVSPEYLINLFNYIENEVGSPWIATVHLGSPSTQHQYRYQQ